MSSQATFRPSSRLMMSHTAVRPITRGKLASAGLTIIELLVAMVVSLILILAVVQAFQVVAQTISDNRAVIEMAGQLRTVAQQMQDDLEGVTVPVRPWISPAAGLGYFRYSEGNANDLTFVAVDSSVGDIDDSICFTSRRRNAPFLGSLNGVVITSEEAEIIWWSKHNDVNQDGNFDNSQGELDIGPNSSSEDFFVIRRALLIRPDLGTLQTFSRPNSAQGLTDLQNDVMGFMNVNDVSVRRILAIDPMTNTVTATLIANSLADLTQMDNRVGHWAPLALLVKSGIHEGEDVMLGHVLAFDIRAYDPDAPVRALPGADGVWGNAGDDDGDGTSDEADEAGWPGSDDQVVRPGDPGWATATLEISRGAYVDLNYNADDKDPNTSLPFGFARVTATAQSFAWAPWDRTDSNPRARRLSAFSGVSAFADVNGNNLKEAGEKYLGLATATYDTWSTFYESDGIDSDGDGTVDEGTNGLDDDSKNGVDDPGERETSPPYPVPLRGVQVVFRMIERDTRQVREVTISSDFTPD